MKGVTEPENQKGGDSAFTFRVKIVQTDLTCGDHLFNSIGEMFGGFNFNNDPPFVYQNSSYISKLYFINSFAGGILKKDRVEDMPERYRRFVRPDNPSEAERIKSLEKELYILANREEVGQNVFYSRLSSPQPVSGDGAFDGGLESLGAALFGELDAPDGFDRFDGGIEGEVYEGYEYEEYEDGEEIKNILHLNSYYDSETYKMSRVEYDFNASGNITVAENGSTEIKYDESEVTGFDGSYIQILFDQANKGMAAVRRKNFFDSWFALEKGKRISVEETDPGYFLYGTVLTTYTKELVNNMTADGGDMRIVYVTEANGVPSEMISHSIRAVRADI